MEERFEKMTNVHALLGQRCPEYAKIMTQEMGKPIKQSEGEIMKCAAHIEYTIAHTKHFLEDQMLENDGKRSFVTHDAIGPIMDIVPWNFPFWMPFKSMIPPLALGNPILLKPAPMCPLTTAAMEDLFEDAGFTDGEFQVLYIDNEMSEKVLSDKRVRGVKFTGSTRGGKEVAAIAGRNMKQGCFELGGSDPFIVLEDSDIQLAVDKGYVSRMVNNGQACINAKRFIVHEEIYERFRDALIEKIKAETKMGDPLDPEMNLGPLADQKQAATLREQVQRSLDKGAEMTYGSLEVPNDLHPGNYFGPIVLENIQPGSAADCEELFGPVFSLFKVYSSQQAIDLANNSDYGLGAAVFSGDVARAERVARKLDAGMIYINDFVQSQSNVPSGGTKDSGYGRECHFEGLVDLSNSKSIVVNP